MLGTIGRGIGNKTDNIIRPLCKARACPHLEYRIQLWPAEREMVELEPVQTDSRDAPGGGTPGRDRKQNKHVMVQLTKERIKGGISWWCVTR